MLFSRKGASGETLRYYQMVNDVQVHAAELTIHISPNGIVNYYQSTYDKSISNINTTPTISSSSAAAIAKSHIKVNGKSLFKKKSYLFIITMA